MPILQYKCRNCSSVFEYLVSASINVELDCISCKSQDVVRMDSTFFYPNKVFCPHDKELDQDHLRGELSHVMADKKQQCGGCGTDGSPGKCKSDGGGCGSGGGCGGGCSCKKQ